MAIIRGEVEMGLRGATDKTSGLPAREASELYSNAPEGRPGAGSGPQPMSNPTFVDVNGKVFAKPGEKLPWLGLQALLAGKR